ncbi:MAG: ribonuclease R [Clostridia bacterium]
MSENIDMKKDVLKGNKNERYLERKGALTSFFSDSAYELMTFKQVSAFFGVSKNDYYMLEQILKELEDEGYIYIDDSKRYGLCARNNMLKCIYQAKTAKFGFGLVDEGNDLYIASINSMSAMNNDEVLVKVISQNTSSSKSREGQVIKILKRNTKKLVGRFIKSTNFGFVQPIDSKIEDIYISKKNSTNIKDGQMVEVELTKYATNTNRSEGKVLSVIGDSNTPNIEVLALYKSYNLDELESFGKDVEKYVEKISDKITVDERKNRIDRTNERIVTIDSEDAKDLDDGICVKKQDNGNYILSVYIADVSHYVVEGTPLDSEALRRGTSIYIPGTVVAMLPKKLSNGVCSLNASVQRLSLAIDMTIDKDGNIIDSNVFKAIIKVEKRMSYTNVYKVITHNLEDIPDYKEYEKDIFIMRELALILNKKRVKMGSINFDIPDTQVVLDGNGSVIDIKPYEITIANKMIEEFMLAANMTIAEKFFFLNMPFIYRIHEKPEEEKLRALNEILANYGKRIKGIKDIHPKAMSDMIEQITDQEEKQIISNAVLRTLKLARYSNECEGHFGLAAKYYCHFTSPIRRYPDLFIHRVISKYIDNNCMISQEEIKKYEQQAIIYSKTASDLEKEATIIERDFDDLYKAIYMEKFVGDEFKGVISSITSFGAFVKLVNTVEGLIPFENMPDGDYYMYDESRHILVGKQSGNTYKIGDKVNVKLVRVDVKLKQLDFKII